MSISYWLDENKINKKSLEFDITIIGGGLAGLSTAYWLLKEDRHLKLAIVEKNVVGYGASGRNAGFVTCGSVEHFNRLSLKHGVDEANEIWKFSEENCQLLKQEIIKNEAETVSFYQRGSFSLASTISEFNELKRSAEIMSESNIKVEIIDENNINLRLGAEGFVGGIKYLNDGEVHPLKLLRKMKEKIIQLNNQTSFLEHEEVFNICESSESKTILTNKSIIKSPIVVFATNAYSPLLHEYFKDKIFPTRGQILVTEPVNKQFMESPCYANFVLDYFRQLPGGEVLIGGFRQLEKETEVGYSDHTTELIQSNLEKFLDNHLPFIKGKKITHRWSGIMGFSVDGQPMIGSLPSDLNTFFVAGFTAHGLGLSFHAGKCLVDLLYGRKIPSFLSAKRFS